MKKKKPQEAKLFVATGEAKDVSFIRRYRMKDGGVQTNPGVNNPNIDHALGTPNETVKLIKIERDDAEDIFIVNFGVHPDVYGAAQPEKPDIRLAKNVPNAATTPPICQPNISAPK